MKKLIFPLILMVATLIACNQPQPAAPAVDTVGEANKALVKQYVDAALKGDTVAMASLTSEDYRSYGPGLGDSTTRANDLKNWSRSWREEFSSFQNNDAGYVAFNVPADGKFPGDWVAYWSVLTLNYKNGNKPVSFWFHGVYRVKDGKINLSRSFYNINDFFQQQGFTITPPAPSK